MYEDKLGQSLIDNLKENPNVKGQRRPKDFCAALINDLEMFCNK